MSKRIETGPVKFGKDWTGVFIRGDEVFGLLLALEQSLDPLADGLALLQVQSFLDVLRSSNENNKSKSVQFLKDIEECWG
jgi:hypothetical protein